MNTPSRTVARKEEASRRRFDRWAKRYERDRRSRWLARLQEEALSALDLRAEDAFLDVGCGTGGAVRQAASVVRRAVGVDLSPGMVERARELAPSIPNAEFHEGDAAHLPFGNGEFTAILCSNSFHHYPDPEGAVHDMARMLALAGRLVIADGCADSRVARLADSFLRALEPGHVRLYRSSELGNYLHGVGLEAVQARTLWGGSYAFVRARKPRQ